MSRYNAAISKLEMPARFLKLPIDERGYPVPKFVEWVDGKPDFRIVKTGWIKKCIDSKLCWLCGEQLGKFMAFVIGPMCAVNRTTSEPPSHLDCARFSARACPFLTQPRRPRNQHGLPEDHEHPAGLMIARNPGVALIWVAKSYRTFKTRVGGGPGLLIKLDDPVATEWFTHGRKATREEIMASIDTGLPFLREMAEQDGPKAVEELEHMVKAGLELVPA